MDLKQKSDRILQNNVEQNREKVSDARKDEEMYSPDTLNSSEERKFKNKS